MQEALWNQRRAQRRAKLDFIASSKQFSTACSSGNHHDLLAKQHAEAVQAKAKVYQAKLKASAAEKAHSQRRSFMQIGQILLQYLDASSAGGDCGCRHKSQLKATCSNLRWHAFNRLGNNKLSCARQALGAAAV